MKKESIMLYLGWQYGEKHSALTVRSTGESVLDATGKVVYCTGQWNSPDNADKIQSTIKALHDLYPDLRGNLVESCEDCLEKTKTHIGTQLYTACETHAGMPRLRSAGNVISCKEWRDEKDFWKVARSSYQQKGNVQLLPSEIRQLRALLLSDGSIYGLQKYVMIILGIKLFLRADELISLRVESFDVSLFLVDRDRGPSALCVKIQVKNDVTPYHMVLWAESEYPEFCPVRHLLYYLRLSGVKKGYMFPPAKLLLHSADGNYDADHYAYDDWLDCLKGMLTKNLNRGDSNGEIYGTHVLRKTAYLFAMFGVLKMYGRIRPEEVDQIYMSSIMKSARHSSIQNAITYAKDAITQYERILAARTQHGNDVSCWKAINMESIGSYRAVCAQQQKRLQKDIPRLAEWYLEDYLGLNPLSKHLSISSGLETALRYRNSEAVSLDNLHALLGENMVPGSSDKAIQMFDVILKNCMANVTPVFPGAMTPNQDGSPSPSPEVQEAVKKKRKRSGGQELEGRLQIGQAKTIEKRPNFV
jgi:hypothetical protein